MDEWISKLDWFTGGAILTAIIFILAFVVRTIYILIRVLIAKIIKKSKGE